MTAEIIERVRTEVREELLQFLVARYTTRCQERFGVTPREQDLAMARTDYAADLDALLPVLLASLARHATPPAPKIPRRWVDRALDVYHEVGQTGISAAGAEAMLVEVVRLARQEDSAGVERFFRELESSLPIPTPTGAKLRLVLALIDRLADDVGHPHPTNREEGTG